MQIDTTGWKKFGDTANAEFYEVEPDILAVVPHEKCRDDATTAAASIDTQLKYLKEKGRRAGVMIFMDRISDQDSGARSIYRDRPDKQYQAGFALVGGTAFGRAVAGFFIGISHPPVPTKMFATEKEAMAWLHTLLAEK
jgi:hypothetical protein